MHPESFFSGKEGVTTSVHPRRPWRVTWRSVVRGCVEWDEEENTAMVDEKRGRGKGRMRACIATTSDGGERSHAPTHASTTTIVVVARRERFNNPNTSTRLPVVRTSRASSWLKHVPRPHRILDSNFNYGYEPIELEVWHQ